MRTAAVRPNRPTTAAAAGSAVALLSLLAACQRHREEPADEPDRHSEELAQIRAVEDAALEETGGHATPWADRSGADPVRIQAFGDGYLGLLASGQVVRLDTAGMRTAAAKAPPGARGWAQSGDTLYVVGQGESAVSRYSLVDGGLSPLEPIAVEGVTGFRDVARVGESTLLLSDPVGAALHTLDLESGERTNLRTCRGALGLESVSGSIGTEFIVANCLLEHELVVFTVEDSALVEKATIVHDGPIWGAALRPASDGLELVALGVENRPLDRTEGFFGYVDSFAFAYRVTAMGAVTAGPTFNLSEVGVVTPKSARFDGDMLVVTGYGSDRIAQLTDVFGDPRAETVVAPAGITELGGSVTHGIAADPLLDGWIVFDKGAWHRVAASSEPDGRSPSLRLGEALAFTTLMGPSNTSEGKMSRFTCETCHFEGRTDGRVHFTGRGEVHAATKTLRGLGANRPHFSRALDRSSTQMVNNEFKVVSKGTDQDPWFSLELEANPWVRELWPDEDPTAVELRIALLEFLAAFDPEKNPHTQGRTAFTPLERQGADVFADRCEHCHSARLITDDASTRLEQPAWEAEIFGAGSIKWASEDRVKTDVKPYVHDEGARPPSLRRLWVKYPYFTNGSGRGLGDVLERIRFGTDFSHDRERGEQLSHEERQALLAFLRIL